jgi:hypothetical protein
VIAAAKNSPSLELYFLAHLIAATRCASTTSASIATSC